MAPCASSGRKMVVSAPPAVTQKSSFSSSFPPRSSFFFLFIMLAPPILTSLLFKSSALLSTSLFLLRGGWSMITSTFSEDQLSPVVNTLDGPVQGKLAYSRNGSPYWQYFSIPFAQPPIGPLRFQPPLPAKPWKEVKQGLQYPPACINFEPLALIRTWGQEDCLYINVFVPASPNGKVRKKYPVLVYIHGGAFVEGQSSFYREAYLMDQPLIVVTFHYRLGPLGFANFQNDTDPRYPRGNQGLKDQRLALRWVQQNIDRFSGDPDRLTLFADSAGAVSLHLHMLAPSSRGLFQKAMIFSGSSLSPWGFTKYAKRTAYSYGARLECPTENPEELLQCFQNMDPHKLSSLQYSWSDPLQEKDSFSPSLEIPHEDAFLIATPEDYLKNGSGLHNVSLLAGVTSGEGGLRSGRFRAMPELIPILDQHWDSALPKVLFLDDPLPPSASRQVRQFYFGNESTFEEDKNRFMEGCTQLTSDALFVGPVHRAVKNHAQGQNNPTYLFYYDYRPHAMIASFSAFSQVKLTDAWVIRWTKLVGGIVGDWVSEFVLGQEGGHRWGVGHAENVFQMWDVVGATKWLTWLDKQFSEDLVRVVGDFAYDRPLSFRGMRWPQINDALEKGEPLPFMRLDTQAKPAVIPDPFRHRMQFWEELRSSFNF